MAKELCTGWFHIVAGRVRETPFWPFTTDLLLCSKKLALNFSDIGALSCISFCFTFLLFIISYCVIIRCWCLLHCCSSCLVWSKNVFCILFIYYLTDILFFYSLCIAVHCVLTCICCFNCMFTLQCESKIPSDRQRFLGWKHLCFLVVIVLYRDSGLVNSYFIQIGEQQQNCTI